MGHRLSKIYTRTGDKGTTGLGDGTRVEKNSLRIAALGDVDELNSCLGLLLTEALPEAIQSCLVDVQHDLFDLGAELCIPGHTSITQVQVTRLENILDQFNDDLPPLKEFILPGGTRPAALCHVARAVCRRAERQMVALAKMETVAEHGLFYINRLSDLLFVLCRALNRAGGRGDVLWQPGKNHDATQTD